MIKLTRGDILQAEAEALVNTVNCDGFMGRGIALQFRKAFPENYRAYKAACNRSELQPGQMLVYDHGELRQPRYVVNFPTKRHWRNRSHIEDIEVGLEALVEEIRQRNIRSVAIPPLGCGLGGLDWAQVRPAIEKALSALPEVHVLLFAPEGPPAVEAMVKSSKVPEMTVGRAVLVRLIRSYLAAVMDPATSLLEIHKLMYFMQVAGEPLNLRYKKALYGPYANNLRHVLNLVEGHFLRGYGDAEDRPFKEILLMPGVAEQAQTLLQNHPDTQARLERVVQLIHGFETPYAMELLATVHWVAAEEGAATAQEAVDKTYAWNPRKQMFQKQHIHRVWGALIDRGWLPRL